MVFLAVCKSVPISYIYRRFIRQLKKKYVWFVGFFLLNTFTCAYLVVHKIGIENANSNAIPIAVLEPDQPDSYLFEPVLSENTNDLNVVIPPARKIAANNDDTIAGPIITLFTTMKLTDEREMINKNSLRLWASMKPWAKLVLFTTPKDDHKWEVYAQELGWHVYPAPKLRLGVPILRDMFTFIINSITPPTPFIGYANSDIIFNLDLNKTLSALQHVIWNKLNGSGLLMVGRRTDASALKVSVIKSIQQLSKEDIVGNVEPSSGYSLDYFITTPEGFPWHKVPDFVVGKPGYDNWLVIKALDWKVKLIDLTYSVTALHQMLDHENTDSGWFSKNVCMNRNLYDPFSVVRGHSDCAPYFTKYLLCGTVIVYKRTMNNFNCMPEVPIWGSPRHITCVGIVEKMKRQGKLKSKF